MWRTVSRHGGRQSNCPRSAPAWRRTGNRIPPAIRDRRTPCTVPRRSNWSKTRRMTSWACSSGSNVTCPAGDLTYPAGTPTTSSPRRALFSFPWYIRCLRTCSSASFIIPVSPSKRRSEYSVGSYTPSASASRTRNRAQSSRRWCQSLQERASRLISSPRISPTRSRATSASSRWKPGRPSIDWPLLPRSSSITWTCDRGPAEGDGAIGQGVLAGGGFLVVEDLLRGRLPDVDDRGPVEVPRLELRGGGRVTRGGGHDAPPAAGPPRSVTVRASRSARRRWSLCRRSGGSWAQTAVSRTGGGAGGGGDVGRILR